MGEKLFLIDTNIILEITLGQERAEECVLFLNKIANEDHPAVITAFSLYSVEITNTSRKLYDALNEILSKINQISSLNIYQTNIDDEILICQIAKEKELKFDDALQYYAAKKLGAVLISFDQHFDKTDIKRAEPIDLLSN